MYSSDSSRESNRNHREHSDTTEALQQELDSLQNERRDLKERLRSTTKKAIFDNLVNRRGDPAEYLGASPNDASRAGLMITSQMSSGDTYALLHEVRLFRCPSSPSLQLIALS